MASNGTGAAWRLGAVALFAIACGSDGGLHSGVAGDKALEDLTSKEIQKICDAANDFIDAALPPGLVARAACSQSALQTGSVETCRIATQACLDALADGGVPGGISVGSLPQQLGDLQCFTSSELESCKASVSELEGCLQNTFANQSRMLHAVSCEALEGTRPSIIQSSGDSPLCEALAKKCPGITNFTRRPEVPGNPLPGNPLPGNPNPNPNPTTGSSDCEDLALEYDGSDCATTSCSSNVRCSCSGVSSSFQVCNSIQGCLSSIDCDVACNFRGSVYSCAQQNTCTSDSDCGGFFCVMSSGSSSGSCSRGQAGASCVDDGDCDSGDCMSDPRLGSLRCKGDTSTGSSCTSDYECTSGICAVNSSTGTQQCSDGEIGDPCSDSSDCQSGAACVYAGSAYKCSDRSNGSPCSSDSDCTSSHCASSASGTTAMCVAGDAGDPCDSSSDCTSGRCVTSQTTGMRTCGYQSGQTCPDGIADCNGECRVAQAICASAECTAACGIASCSPDSLATWNSSDKEASITLSNGDLTASATSSQIAVRATTGETTGHWYWEVSADSVNGSSYTSVGVLTMTGSLDFGLGNGIAPGAGYGASGSFTSSNGNSASGCGFTSGSVVGVALDLSSRVIYFSVNGVWQGGGDPDAGSGGLPLGSGSDALYPAVSLGYGDVLTVNFGQSAFAHAPPAGYEGVAQ